MTFLPQEIAQSTSDREFVDELNKVILENISNPDFGVEQLAKALYLSLSSLSRKINAITGESPSEYLRSRRLLKAAELMRENYGSITEIAFEVGFKNLSHFSRSFKEKFHQLPSVYMALE